MLIISFYFTIAQKSVSKKIIGTGDEGDQKHRGAILGKPL